MSRRIPHLVKSIKFPVLAFIAIIAGLFLLSVTDSRRAEAPLKQQTSGFHGEPALESMPVTDDAPLPAPGDTGSSAVAPTPAQTFNWLEVLYPELFRVSELETEPAAMALAELVPMLTSEDLTIRLAAVESIGDMSIPAVLPILSMALSDPDPQLRVVALESLATLGDVSAGGYIEPLLYDSHHEVRLAAIDALAALDAKNGIHALASLLSDAETSIRRRAVDALGDIGGESAMQYLRQARYDPDESIRINADSILAESEYEANRQIEIDATR